MAPGAVVRLEGLPFRVSKEELLDFFSECKIYNELDGIHLIMNREGRASGLGYVELESKDDVSAALDKDQKNIGNHNRYAKIQECDLAELTFYRNKSSSNKDESKLIRVRMQGMPFRVSEYEISRWFDPTPCVDVDVHLNSEGKPSGEATAFFENKEDAEEAVKKDREEMQGRYINLSMENKGQPLLRSGFYIRMKGLPFRASEQEMRDFFLPDAECASVRIIFNREGRPSGDAIAEFESEEEAEKAMKKNREHLGSRFVILSREYGDGRGNDSYDYGGRGGGGGGGRGRDRGESMDMSASSGKFALRMGGLPFRATEKQIQDWFSKEAQCTFVKIILNRDGRPSGEAMAEFDTEEEAEAALRLNREYLGDRFVILTPQY